MAILIVQGKVTADQKKKGLKGNYTNTNAPEKLIDYITREGDYKYRKDSLLKYGTKGLLDTGDDVDFLIQQIKVVQKVNNIEQKRGRRMYHETLSLTDEEFEGINNDPAILSEVADKCADTYFDKGHQVVYAVHYEKDKKAHIHMAVNAINYKDGKKFHSNNDDLKEREELFKNILREYIDREDKRNE